MKIKWLWAVIVGFILIVAATLAAQSSTHSYQVVGPVLKGQMQWTVVEVRKDGVAIVRPMVAPDWGISGAANLAKNDVLNCTPKNVSDASIMAQDGLPVSVHHLELECDK